MDRRTFLHPGSMAKSISPPGEMDGPSIPSPESEKSPAQLLCFSQKAMGTVFEWVFPFGFANASRLASGAFALVDQLEDLLSVYRPDSEVSRLNSNGHMPGGCLVSQTLWDLVRQSKNLYDLSEGAFDPACGRLVKNWGFLKGPFRVPSEGEIALLLAEGGMKRVEIREENHHIFHQTEGLEWNFGAIGKGYTIDCVAKWLESRNSLDSFLLHSGRSSIYAKGRSPAEESGWVVQVNHPSTQSPMANLRLCDGALATSAATFRHFEVDGRAYGHVLDPRKGFPSEELLSATVFAPQSAVADALSTAVFVAGAELAERLSREDSNLGFLLLEKGENRMPRFLGKMKEMVLDQ